MLVQYPTTDGHVETTRPLAGAHDGGALFVVAADLLALTLPARRFGADICGSSQRFGVPLGFSGPHAAFLHPRQAPIPGRLVGVSRTATATRAAAGAADRKQHIRRDKATSNICTAPSARGHGEHVRGLPRARRAVCDRASRPWADRAPGRRAAPARLGSRARPLLRHPARPRRGACGRHPSRGAHAAHQPPRLRRRIGGGQPRRDDPREGPVGPLGRVRARPRSRLHGRGSGGGHGRGLRGAAGPHQPLSPPRGLQPAPLGARDAPLHPSPAGARPLPHDLDDPPGVVHDEAQRDLRDAARHLARVRGAASLRASGPGQGLRGALRAARSLAGRDHGLRGHVPPAQRGLAGRIRGAARHPRLPPLARGHRARRVPHR